MPLSLELGWFKNNVQSLHLIIFTLTQLLGSKHLDQTKLLCLHLLNILHFTHKPPLFSYRQAVHFGLRPYRNYYWTWTSYLYSRSNCVSFVVYRAFARSRALDVANSNSKRYLASLNSFYPNTKHSYRFSFSRYHASVAYIAMFRFTSYLFSCPKVEVGLISLMLRYHLWPNARLVRKGGALGSLVSFYHQFHLFKFFVGTILSKSILVHHATITNKHSNRIFASYSSSI